MIGKQTLYAVLYLQSSTFVTLPCKSLDWNEVLSIIIEYHYVNLMYM